MANNSETSTGNGGAKVPLSARVDSDLRDQLEREGGLRGHTLSQAVEFALKAGVNSYLEEYPRIYEPAAA